MQDVACEGNVEVGLSVIVLGFAHCSCALD